VGIGEAEDAALEILGSAEAGDGGGGQGLEGGLGGEDGLEHEAVLGGELMIGVGDVLIFFVSGGDGDGVVDAGGELLGGGDDEWTVAEFQVEEGEGDGIDIGTVGEDGRAAAGAAGTGEGAAEG